MLHRLERKQQIRAELDEVWEFISNPNNLSLITPDYMGFEVLGNTKPGKMYAGQIIEYFVRPLFGIKMHWATEITHVRNNEFFVDEQRFGPYAFWHHQHHIRPTDKGVEMTDIVHYKLPLGFIGNIINKIIVGKKLQHIFDYRFQKIEELFNHEKKFNQLSA